MNRSARSPLPSSLLTDLLEALGESKVSQDPLDLAAVAPDASHYLLTPSVLVRAESTSDVAAAMAAAKRYKSGRNESVRAGLDERCHGRHPTVLPRH